MGQNVYVLEKTNRLKSRKTDMCTMICERAEMEGSAKGREGWFPLEMANVSYDHPFNAPWEYGVNIDFVNQSQGVGSRVAVELSPESAKRLADLSLIHI